MAQQPLRVGVIDQADGAMLQGAHLAAREINAEGGLVGADGTVFNLIVVDTPPDNMDIAVANLRQAGCDAPYKCQPERFSVNRIPSLSLIVKTRNPNCPTGSALSLRHWCDRL